MELPVEVIDPAELESAKAAVTEQSLDLLMVFPEDFDQSVAAYEASSGQAAPNVELYYNSASTNSSFVYRAMAELLDAYGGYDGQLLRHDDAHAADDVPVHRLRGGSAGIHRG